MTNLTLRNVKGSALTYEEGDANFANLDSDSPWVVAAGRIYYPGNVGIGPNSSNPTYHLDFGEGDSLTNEATIGTSDADLHVHVDGARKFKVTTNSQERLTLTTTGKFGIGQTNPQFELDVDGYANISNTLYGNAVEANSFTDGTLSISGGSILNAKRIVSTTQIDFTQLYDRSTGYRVSSIDSELTFSTTAFPTSFAVKFVTTTLSNSIDSNYAWASSKFDSSHSYVISSNNEIQENIDSVYSSLLEFKAAQDSAAASTGLQEVTDIGSVTTNTVRLSGGVETTKLTGSHLGYVGLELGSAVLPLDNNGDLASGTTDLGSSTYKFKDAYFSGTVSASGRVVTGSGESTGAVGGTVNYPTGAVYVKRVTKDGNPVWQGQGAGDVTSEIHSNGNATFSGTVNADNIKGSGDKGGFLFDNSKRIIPTENGSPSNGKQDFGTVNNKFKDAHFSGVVNAHDVAANKIYRTHTGGCGFLFDTSNELRPTDNTGALTNGTMSIGNASYKFKNSYFSGTVNATTFTGNLNNSLTINGTTYNNSSAVNITTPNTTYSTATSSKLGLVKIGYAANGKNYPVQLNSGQMYVNVPWSNTTYSTATNSALGLVKIGYAANGKNYPVQLNNGQMYVNVPWTNTNTTYTAGTGLTLVGTEFRNAAPDQTVTLTGEGSTTITGTYPNFTITSSSGSTISGGGNGIAIATPAPGVSTPYMTGSYTGTFTATGDVVAFSDVAFKEEINPIVGALEKVSQVGGYTFKRKDDESRKYTGVIAQEIQKVLPEAVHTSEEGLSVAYGNLTGLLIEAVKELNAKVKDLESKLGV